MSNIYTRIIKVILVGYLLLNSVIWAVSPFIVHSYLSDFLLTKQLVLDGNSTIRYNPFISQINITDLQIKINKLAPSQSAEPEQKQSMELVALSSATIEFSLFKLFANRAVVENFEIHGLQADVTNTLAHLSSLPSEPVEESTKPEQTENTWLSSLTFETLSFSINSSKVLFELAGDKQIVEFSKVTLSNLELSAQVQSAELNISLLLNGALLELSSDLHLEKGVGEFKYDLAVQQVNLHAFNSILLQPVSEQLKNVEGLLSIKLQQEVAFDKAEIASQIQHIDLLLTDFSAQQIGAQTSRLSLEELAINAGVIDVLVPYSLVNLLNKDKMQTINLAQELTLRSNLNLSQKSLLVTMSDSAGVVTTELLKVAMLNIPDIDFLLENGRSLLQTDLVEFDSVTLLDPHYTDASPSNSDTAQDNYSALVDMTSVTLSDIQLSNQSLNIANIDFAKINAAINKQRDGRVVQLNALIPVPLPEQKNTSKAVKKDVLPMEVEQELTSADPEQFQLYVGKVNLSDTLSFAIEDNSVSPSYASDIKINTFTLEPIDNSTPSVTSTLLLTGSLDQYSKFSVEANLKPFNKETYVKADITVTEFDLSTITAYLKEILAIESGHLNTVTNFIIDDDLIKGNAKLNLSRVELGEAVEYDESNTVDTLIPVNVALGMLKDGKGNIELDVPVDGSLDSPDFRLSGFMALLIQRATMSATKKYLMNAFVPYANIIQIGMQAGEFILKVRFQDLMLTLGETDLPKSSDVFLEQFSALMLDKKATQITICAMSTKADIGVQHSEKLTSKQLDKLNQLSLNRMKNFKNHMVNNYEISSARLLLCAPKIDTGKDAKPRLTFTN